MSPKIELGVDSVGTFFLFRNFLLSPLEGKDWEGKGAGPVCDRSEKQSADGITVRDGQHTTPRI